MPPAFRHRKIMKEVPHSIPDLFSENAHELGRTLFSCSSDLAPNARRQARRAVGAQRMLYAVACMPWLGGVEAKTRLWPRAVASRLFGAGLHAFRFDRACCLRCQEILDQR